ncbi:hypothetical protein PR048_029609 [Dryococelus australis]|uniref:Protein kinase domain-containing protein n=1 Tax=Dryococelus australis TaxID=614101 RepID=A0ABQ9GGE7_9NEOP|nr:hypothetical protein PR048_029609 [Dryococelus australis]
MDWWQPHTTELNTMMSNTKQLSSSCSSGPPTLETALTDDERALSSEDNPRERALVREWVRENVRGPVRQQLLRTPRDGPALGVSLQVTPIDTFCAVNIATVFENREKMVLVMEYAAGGELYDYLSDRKVLTEEESRRIFRQIATAVYYCHKHKICHRDLKLENILLDEHGSAKIADFGLSNVFNDQRLLSTFCGSPLYASPEIVKGTPYHGPEVDCWSLGVLLYTLVYGAMPFDGSNFKRLVRQISNGDYFEPKKPSPASPLIRDMLNVAPARRADIEKICSHWWVNKGYEESCLDVAEELANQTPVRLDLLLSLAPPGPGVGSDKLMVGSENDGDGTAGMDDTAMVPARSQSVGSLMELDHPTVERKIREFETDKRRGSTGADYKDAPPKRKLEDERGIGKLPLVYLCVLGPRLAPWSAAEVAAGDWNSVESVEGCWLIALEPGVGESQWYFWLLVPGGCQRSPLNEVGEVLIGVMGGWKRAGEGAVRGNWVAVSVDCSNTFLSCHLYHLLGVWHKAGTMDNLTRGEQAVKFPGCISTEDAAHAGAKRKDRSRRRERERSSERRQHRSSSSSSKHAAERIPLKEDATATAASEDMEVDVQLEGAVALPSAEEVPVEPEPPSAEPPAEQESPAAKSPAKSVKKKTKAVPDKSKAVSEKGSNEQASSKDSCVEVPVESASEVPEGGVEEKDVLVQKHVVPSEDEKGDEEKVVGEAVDVKDSEVKSKKDGTKMKKVVSKTKKNKSDLTLGKLGSPEKSGGSTPEDLASPTRTVERRRSKIFETAEKFNHLLSGGSEPAGAKPKKVFIPGVKVSDAKQAFERKSSISGPSVPSPGPVKSATVKKVAEPVVNGSSPVSSEVCEAANPAPCTADAAEDVKVSKPQDTVKSVTKNEPGESQVGKTSELVYESETMVNGKNNLADAENEDEVELKLVPALPIKDKSSEQEEARIKKLREAREIISNAITEENKKDIGDIMKRIAPGRPPVPAIKTKSVAGSGPTSPTSQLPEKKIEPEKNDTTSPEKKSSKVEIILKSATLPRRKTSKAEIKLDYPNGKVPPVEFRTEVAQMVGGATLPMMPNRLKTQRSEVAFPVAAAPPASQHSRPDIKKKLTRDVLWAKEARHGPSVLVCVRPDTLGDKFDSYLQRGTGVWSVYRTDAVVF